MPRITRPSQPALFTDTTTAPEATVTAPAKPARKSRAARLAMIGDALARVTEATPAAAPVATTPDRSVRLGDLVVATAGSRADRPTTYHAAWW